MSTLYHISGLEDAQVERLDDGLVKYCQQMLGVKLQNNEWMKKIKKWKRFDQESGLLLDEANFNIALGILGGREIKRRETDKENTVSVTLRYDQPLKPVASVQCWHSGAGPEPEPFMRIISEVLLPHLTCDVVVHVPGTMHVQPPRNDGAFHLNIWSAPVNSATAEVSIPQLWGIDQNLSRNIYLPTGHGVGIFDDDDNCIGELVGDNDAYSFVDMIRHGTVNEHKALRRFSEELITARTSSPKERVRKQAAAKKQRLDEMKERYAAFCENRIKLGLKEARAAHQAADKRLQAAQAEYQAAMSNMDQCEINLHYHTEHAAELRKALDREYELFAADPKFIAVVPTESRLKVYTRTLYCFNKPNNKVVEIGEMRIEILLGESDYADPIRIYNMSQIRAGRPSAKYHPHSTGSGHICYGYGTLGIFQQYIKRRELYAAASFAVQFVESVHGHSIAEWRKIETEERERLRAAGMLPAGA